MQEQGPVVAFVRCRAPELDGLRGLAILLVVLGHGGGVGLDFGGPVGVTVFFVLSGYLITGLLAREVTETGDVNLRAFWARRAQRVIPAMVLPAVLATCLIGWYAGWGEALWRVAALPVSNYVSASGSEMWALAHTWSLAVEEQFYVLWPMFFFGLHRIPPLRWVVAATLVFLAMRVVTLSLGNNDWGYFALSGNAGALLTGAVLALSAWRAPRWAGRLGLAGVVGLSVTPWDGAFGASFVPTVAVGLSALLLAGSAGVPFLRVRALRWCGRVSYGWYLWHFPFVWMFPASTVSRWIGLGVALGLATASWYLLERPLLARRGSAAAAVALADSVSVVTPTALDVPDPQDVARDDGRPQRLGTVDPLALA